MQDRGDGDGMGVSCLVKAVGICWGHLFFFWGAYGAYAGDTGVRDVQVVGVRKGWGDMNELCRSQMSSPHTLIR